MVKYKRFIVYWGLEFMYEELIREATSSYKKKEYSRALDIYEKLREFDNVKFEKQCIYNYMWCLYRVKINTQDAFKTDNIKTTNEIIKYIMNHQSNKDLLYQLVVFKILKYLKNKQNFEAAKFNYWLDKLNPDFLSEEVYKFEYSGKKILCSSNKEEWYALKSKVYEKLEMYSECIKISYEALDKLKELHNGNDIWFNRRIAISKSKLGERNEAIQMLEEILKYKKDWFIYKDIANIYTLSSKNEEALNYYIKSILLPGEDSKKINLFWDTGNTFKLLDKSDEEVLLKSYSVKLRLANEWKFSSEEKSFWNYNKEFIDNNDIRTIRNFVIETVKRHKWKESDKLEGYISNILSNNKAGFIKVKDNSYYFKMNEIQNRRKDIQAGMKVYFFTDKSFDKKKQRETDIAVNITIIE